MDRFDWKKTDTVNIDEKIEKLSKYYNVHKTEEVIEFIKEHREIIPYLEKITPIINSYFPNKKKCLTFCKDPEFEELNDITIYIKSTKQTFESDWKKFDKLRTEILKNKEYPRKIKNLVSISLWC